MSYLRPRDDKKHSKRVIDGQKTHENSHAVEAKASFFQRFEDHVLAEKSRERRQSAQRKKSHDEKNHGQQIFFTAFLADLPNVIRVIAVDEGTRRQEKQRLEIRVSREMKHARDRRTGPDPHHHEPELADRGISEDLFDIALDRREGSPYEGRQTSDDQDD